MVFRNRHGGDCYPYKPPTVREGLPPVSVKDKGELVELLPKFWSSTKGRTSRAKGGKTGKLPIYSHGSNASVLMHPSGTTPD